MIPPTRTAALLLSLLTLSTTVRAADAPLLAVPGDTISESPLTALPPAPWKVAKGKWEPADGALRGAELPEDKHGAVMRLAGTFSDFVLDYEFKFDGAKATSLSINGAKGHMARISISPGSVSIQRDDDDHEGPGKAVIFARFARTLAPDAWHKVHLEMVGDTLVGKVDDLTAWGSDPLFTQPKSAPGFTVAGQSVLFKNFTLRKATLNPAWDTAKAALPKPGEKLDPAAPRPAAAGKPGKPGKKAAAKKPAPAATPEPAAK